MSGSSSGALVDIDMEQHTGEHPRIGAVDVIPFVPLGDTSMDACVELARDVWRPHRRPARDPRLPLRRSAATRSDRVKLADVRRGQYEGLRAEIGQQRPPAGLRPGRMHPRFGAVAVGARPFLIAWNINLDSDDVELAKRIARRVRESGGGPAAPAGQRVPRGGAGARPPRTRAGVDEPARLPHDAAVAGMGGRRRAGRRGRRGAWPSRSCIGLAPLAALLDVADHAGAAPERAGGASASRPPRRRSDCATSHR